MGDEVYAVMREPPGVANGALVAWGSAGRGLNLARSSNGWPSSGYVVDVVIKPTPVGVGVNGGGLERDSTVGLRRLGMGVVGTAEVAALSVEGLLAGDVVAESVGLAFRFLDD
jgi:hypothetical protein